MKKAILVSLALLPSLALAASFDGVSDLATSFGSLLKTIIPIVFTIAIIYFFWGVAKYILAAGDAKAAAEGRSIMIYGIIAVAVMASVYGLVQFLQDTFDINGAGTVDLPNIPDPQP